MDTIEFDIPGSLDSIVPTSPLPAITEAVTIDGFTQTGAGPDNPKIRINGTNAGRRANGLKISADNTMVRGLVINRFRQNGILLDGVTGNVVEGNYIGTDQTGVKDHANCRAGVRVVDGFGNTIGGTGSDQPNLISWNGGGGVRVEGLAATGNSILSNRIYNNAGLGIDLGDAGVTENDDTPPFDSDTGPNNLQNFPAITSASTAGGVSGTLESTPGQNFTVQCFATGGEGASEHGEGRTLLGEDTSVTTDAQGNAAFDCSSPVPDTVRTVSATATNQNTHDTSEFSLNHAVG